MMMTKLNSLRRALAGALISTIKKAPVLLAAYLAVTAAPAAGADINGYFSVDEFYSKDSSAAYDRSLLTSRLKLDVTKLNKAGTLEFHFDGSERVNLGSKDYAQSTSNDRIDVMNIAYEGQSFHLSAGRLWPKELAIERVDGLNAVLKAGNFGIGLFGGLNPNPYTEAFTTDFTTAGAYAYYRNGGASAKLAFTHKGYKGGTDREYVYGEVSYFPEKGFSLYSSMTVDIDQLVTGAKLTNGIVELTYRPDYTKSVTVGYNQFRAFRLYKSMDYAIDDSRQEAYYISGNYRFLGKYTVYGRLERQSRYYPAVQTELKNATVLGGGFNAADLFGTRVNMDLNATFSDSYGSLHNTYTLQVDRLNWEVLQLIAHISYTQNEYGTTNNDNIWAFGAGAYLYLFKSWNVSASVDVEHGRFYDVSNFMTRVSRRF